MCGNRIQHELEVEQNELAPTFRFFLPDLGFNQVSTSHNFILTTPFMAGIISYVL
jgi:hypothetical protein